MKKLLTITLALFTLNSQAAEKRTAVAVAEFENKSAEVTCNRDGAKILWRSSWAQGMTETLVGNVARHGGFEVVERQQINDMYKDEFELINSDGAKTRERGKFKTADVRLIGAVTKFEFCAGKTGGSVDVGKIFGFGSLSVGAKGATAKVAVELRAVDVRTGTVLGSVKGEAMVTDRNFGIDSDLGFDFDTESNAALEDAAEQAVEKAFRRIARKIAS